MSIPLVVRLVADKCFVEHLSVAIEDFTLGDETNVAPVVVYDGEFPLIAFVEDLHDAHHWHRHT